MELSKLKHRTRVEQTGAGKQLIEGQEMFIWRGERHVAKKVDRSHNSVQRRGPRGGGVEIKGWAGRKPKTYDHTAGRVWGHSSRRLCGGVKTGNQKKNNHKTKPWLRFDRAGG